LADILDSKTQKFLYRSGSTIHIPHFSLTSDLIFHLLVLDVNCVHKWTVEGENPYKVDGEQITQRAKLLHKYLSDETKELQALYALQALMVQMEQPASECCFGFFFLPWGFSFNDLV